MVLSMIIAMNTAPALLGTQEAIRQGQAKEKREEHRARRCNLIASAVHCAEINGKRVILLNNKLYIDTRTGGSSVGHPFAGYYLPYPDSDFEGLVSTIMDEAPVLNWIYVDRDTFEVKHGVRAEAQPNLTGPFDCTRQDRRLTFDGWEGFLAVEEDNPYLWAIYFDIHDDGLRGKTRRPQARVFEIELTRKEKRWVKDTPTRLEDQKTQNVTEAADESQSTGPDHHSEVDGDDQRSGSGLPSKGLDLRNADLTLGSSNKHHTPQSKMLSQRLANSAIHQDRDLPKPDDEDDTKSLTTDMQSVFSEAGRTRDNHTPASSVRGEDATQPQSKPEEGIPSVPEIPNGFVRKARPERAPPKPMLGKTSTTRESPWPGLPAAPKVLGRKLSSSKKPEPQQKPEMPTSPSLKRTSKRLSTSPKSNEAEMAAREDGSGGWIKEASRFSDDSGVSRTRSPSGNTSVLKNAIARFAGLSR